MGCKHKWKQEYLFMQNSWFKCELCGEKRFWCGTLSHTKPEDCSTHEECLGKKQAKSIARDKKIMAETKAKY